MATTENATNGGESAPPDDASVPWACKLTRGYHAHDEVRCARLLRLAREAIDPPGAEPPDFEDNLTERESEAAIAMLVRYVRLVDDDEACAHVKFIAEGLFDGVYRHSAQNVRECLDGNVDIEAVCGTYPAPFEAPPEFVELAEQAKAAFAEKGGQP